ncbi:hypothetical protein MP228_004985 [Amoeboaphelidium protococcarum]|nr:hypothetical protein MP228_006823 [Amoeboaphelidium protococcarum]KAI3649516.1 hypothetical protein MP228_005148 [Amoeboaphelidium protococcarum]KAI3650158.1 hypothetical protein MP228_004985 [Amoeboaphelidium protococcarum]
MGRPKKPSTEHILCAKTRVLKYISQYPASYVLELKNRHNIDPLVEDWNIVQQYCDPWMNDETKHAIPKKKSLEQKKLLLVQMMDLKSVVDQRSFEQRQLEAEQSNYRFVDHRELYFHVEQYALHGDKYFDIEFIDIDSQNATGRITSLIEALNEPSISPDDTANDVGAQQPDISVQSEQLDQQLVSIGEQEAQTDDGVSTSEGDIQQLPCTRSLDVPVPQLVVASNVQSGNNSVAAFNAAQLLAIKEVPLLRANPELYDLATTFDFAALVSHNSQLLARAKELGGEAAQDVQNAITATKTKRNQFKRLMLYCKLHTKDEFVRNCTQSNGRFLSLKNMDKIVVKGFNDRKIADLYRLERDDIQYRVNGEFNQVLWNEKWIRRSKKGKVTQMNENDIKKSLLSNFYSMHDPTLVVDEEENMDVDVDVSNGSEDGVDTDMLE